MNNETVPVGRDAILQCIVKNLQDYKVLIQFWKALLHDYESGQHFSGYTIYK